MVAKNERMEKSKIERDKKKNRKERKFSNSLVTKNFKSVTIIQISYIF